MKKKYYIAGEAMICYSTKHLSAIVKSFSMVLMLLVLSVPVMADWSQRQQITSSPRGVGAQFGNAVAINGGTMVVGARFDSTTASQAGAAYVFVLSGATWVQQAVLLAPDGALGDKFGYSVAISEDTIVLGSYNDDTAFSNGGSAYVLFATARPGLFSKSYCQATARRMTNSATLSVLSAKLSSSVRISQIFRAIHRLAPRLSTGGLERFGRRPKN